MAYNDPVNPMAGRKTVYSKAMTAKKTVHSKAMTARKTVVRPKLLQQDEEIEASAKMMAQSQKSEIGKQKDKKLLKCDGTVESKIPIKVNELFEDIKKQCYKILGDVKGLVAFHGVSQWYKEKNMNKESNVKNYSNSDHSIQNGAVSYNVPTSLSKQKNSTIKDCGYESDWSSDWSYHKELEKKNASPALGRKKSKRTSKIRTSIENGTKKALVLLKKLFHNLQNADESDGMKKALILLKSWIDSYLNSDDYAAEDLVDESEDSSIVLLLHEKKQPILQYADVPPATVTVSFQNYCDAETSEKGHN